MQTKQNETLFFECKLGSLDPDQAVSVRSSLCSGSTCLAKFFMKILEHNAGKLIYLRCHYREISLSK